MHSCLTIEKDRNLSLSQKEFWKWNCRLGFLEFKRIQNLMKAGGLGNGRNISAASKVDLHKDPIICASCAFGKAKRRSSSTKTTMVSKDSDLEDVDRQAITAEHQLYEDDFEGTYEHVSPEITP
jgi:hypothetical protein